MKTSPSGVQFIFDHEVDPKERKAAEFVAFLDTIAQPPVWTIGVGHTDAAGPPQVGPGMRVSREEALSILASDLRGVERRVSKALGSGISQAVFDAAVSFDFNTGGILTASWVGAFHAGDLADAERRFKLWNKAGTRIVPGLVNRRRDEWHLLSTGAYRLVGGSSPVAPTTPPPDVEPIEPQPAPAPGWLSALVAFLTQLFKPK